MFKIKEYNIHDFNLSNKKNRFKTTCPFCSSDRKKSNEPCATVDKQGEWFHCHHCGKKGKLHSYEKMGDKKYIKPKPYGKPPSKIEGWFKKERKISRNTLNKLGITEGSKYFSQVGKERNAICYNYYLEGELINIKYRDAEKNFRFTTDAKLIPYNMDGIIGEDVAVIVEGENDVAACIESGVNNVISVPNGAQKKGKHSLEYMANVAEYLTHEKYILFTDNDEAGRRLREDLAAYLGKDKCYIVDYRDRKDANQLLIDFGNMIINTIINEARPYPIDGIIKLDEVWESILDEYNNGTNRGETTHISWLDPHFRWVRGWIYLFTGYPAHGKSTILAWLLMVKAIEDNWRVAIFSPEDGRAEDFYIKLIEAYAKKSFNQEYHNRITRDELYEAKAFINHHFIYVYPEENHTIDAIDEKLEHLIKTENIDATAIDPFNQLDRVDKNTRSDLYISEYCRRRKRFAIKHNIVDITVEHPRTPKDPETAKNHPDMFNINEGLTWGKKMDVVASVHKPNKHIDLKDSSVDFLIDKVKVHRIGGEPAMINLKFLRAKNEYVPINS